MKIYYLYLVIVFSSIFLEGCGESGCIGQETLSFPDYSKNVHIIGLYADTIHEDSIIRFDFNYYDPSIVSDHNVERLSFSRDHISNLIDGNNFIVLNGELEDESFVAVYNDSSTMFEFGLEIRFERTGRHAVNIEHGSGGIFKNCQVISATAWVNENSIFLVDLGQSVFYVTE